MRMFLIILSTLLIAIVQVGFVNPLGAWRPDFLIAFLVFGAFMLSARELAASTLSGALILELFSSVSFGIAGASLCIAIAFIYVMRRNLFVQGHWLPVIASAAIVVALFHGIAYFLQELLVFVGIVKGDSFGYFTLRFIRATFPAIIITVCASALLFAAFPRGVSRYE